MITLLGYEPYFSINPAMSRSANGRKIMAAIPGEPVLTETDGPFVMLDKRPAEPADVARVEQALADLWRIYPLDARTIVSTNFQTIPGPLRR